VDRNGRLYPIEIKATSTILPGHAASLNRWRALAGDLATEGLMVENTSEAHSLKGCHVISWEKGLDMI